MTISGLLGRLLYALAWLTGRLPWRARAVLAGAAAGTWARLRRREYRVCLHNLRLARPDLAARARPAEARAILRETALNLFDTLAVWTRPPARNLRRVRAVHGGEHFRAALSGGRGLIVAAPHYGHWELLNQYLAAQAPLAIVYRPPGSAAVEAFLRRARQVPGIEQVRAESAGVRRLLHVLRGGGTAGILPDQQPKLGEGEFAPFFGVQALTMTLLPRLAARTGATVLFAYAERCPDGDYEIGFEPAAAALSGADPRAAVAALNAGVEAIARRDFRQYQWTYKRYSLRPPDSGEANPYWPDCYSRRALRRARLPDPR